MPALGPDDCNVLDDENDGRAHPFIMRDRMVTKRHLDDGPMLLPVRL